MATKHGWQRAYGQYLPTGTTPLAPQTNNTATAGGAGELRTSSLRLRTDIELYVVAGGGNADANLAFVYETIMAVGSILAPKGALTDNSPIPLGNANNAASLSTLGDWVQWEYLYPTIDFVDVNVPQLVIVTWRPKGGTIDTQARRAENSSTGIDLWMPWEVQDGSGLINTTDANGNFYYLGARFAQAWQYEIVS